MPRVATSVVSEGRARSFVQRQMKIGRCRDAPSLDTISVFRSAIFCTTCERYLYGHARLPTALSVLCCCRPQTVKIACTLQSCHLLISISYADSLTRRAVRRPYCACIRDVRMGQERMPHSIRRRMHMRILSFHAGTSSSSQSMRQWPVLIVCFVWQSRLQQWSTVRQLSESIQLSTSPSQGPWPSENDARFSNESVLFPKWTGSPLVTIAVDRS